MILLEYYINKNRFYSAFFRKISLNVTIEQAFNVFRRFRQAKFAYNNSILSSSQFFNAPAVSKNETCYKSSQNCLKNNHSPPLDQYPRTGYCRTHVGRVDLPKTSTIREPKKE
jgi:hypothetical protein